MIIFVQPIEGSNQTWIVDGGFGSPGLARPILLSSEESNVVRGAMTSEMHRLVRCTHPDSAIGMFVLHYLKDGPSRLIFFFFFK
jgi:arylamine N-acetyltransferase